MFGLGWKKAWYDQKRRNDLLLEENLKLRSKVEQLEDPHLVGMHGFWSYDTGQPHFGKVVAQAGKELWIQETTPDASDKYTYVKLSDFSEFRTADSESMSPLLIMNRWSCPE